MELFWPLLVARWLHLWSLLALFGAALFAVYAPPGGADALDKFKAWLAAIALASGVGFLTLMLVEFISVGHSTPGHVLMELLQEAVLGAIIGVIMAVTLGQPDLSPAGMFGRIDAALAHLEAGLPL